MKRLASVNGNMIVKDELVSIAMATYNGEVFLRKQLDSIYNQSYKKIEVVVCDDCSTDKTVAILDEYKKKRGLQYYVNEKNIGFIKNFERVLRLCRGEYIALADQDDIWQPQKIEKLIKAIGDCSLAYSDAIYINDNDIIIAPSVRKYAGLPVVSGKPFRVLAFNSFVIGCTAMVKSKLLTSAIPFPHGVYSHDWWLSIVASKCDGLCFVDEPLVCYRRHSRNIIGLKKGLSSLSKLFGFLYTPPQKNDFVVQEKKLASILEHPLFSEEEMRVLKYAYEYFHDRITSRIHLRAFIISLKYGKYIFPTFSPLWRIKPILGALVR
ncbi:MAG TPA: glycosyltransferase family 2 protein [Chitinivibrionales bacterium]|nr:glycosyltransferase family 2 protein [Chitinivibrionales bacterium]